MLTPPEQNRIAWFVAVLLFAGSVLSYVDRAVLGVVMPQVRRDLSLTNTEYSLAVNAFLVMYMTFYVLGGRVADRLGCRRTFSLTVIFWSLASMAHALTRGLASLCAYRALLGMGEGGFYPTAMRGIAEWFRPENRAKAVGVLICGISVGMLLTPPIVAWITFHYGWRAAFLMTGALGFMVVPPWLVLHGRIRRAYGQADPAPASRSARAEAETSGDLALGQVLRRRKYWLFLLARAVTDAVWYFYLFWLPGYFQDIRHYDLESVGKLLWIPYFCADVGALGGAWLSSALIQRGLGVDRGRKSVLIASGILCVVGTSAYFVSANAWALALVSLAMFGHMSWASNLHTVITEVTPRKHVAALYGLTGAAGTLLGALTQPLVGHAVDRVGYAPAFVGSGLTYTLALGLLVGAGRIEPIR